MLRVFMMNVTGQDFCGERWAPYLSEERKEAAARRRQERERRLCLGAEALLNLSLERVGAEISLPAVYERNQFGKSYLVPDCGIYVNWSHSGEYVLCALSDGEVGADIQLAAKYPKETLVRRVLQPEERRYYESVKPGERQRLFYRYWTVKESFLKALGSGFSQDLKSFWVDMEKGEENPLIVQNIDGRAWSCRVLDLGIADYEAAVCCEGNACFAMESAAIFRTVDMM